MVLNGMTSHFGAGTGCPEYLDPYTRQRRLCYVEDIADEVRVIDALPNIEWLMTTSALRTIPGAIADKIDFLQTILNTSKPAAYGINDVASLREMLEVCAMVAGGEKELRAKPFFVGSAEPVSPLVHGKDALEKSLLCAEKGIPVYVYSMPMGGATHPATYAGVLAVTNAEILSSLVALQLKNPGTPVIYGAEPNIMDMSAAIFPFGSPELAFLVTALTELSHYYKLPILGNAGCTDADTIGAQAATEATYSILLQALSGADFIHNVGTMLSSNLHSPELTVFGNEIIDMVKVAMQGIEINDETLPLDLIEKVGPGGTYISESHTLKHFRKFWVPEIFDRSMAKREGIKSCEDLLNEKTIEILKTHKPKPLPEDLLKELRKVEKNWLKRVGLEQYPKRE